MCHNPEKCHRISSHLQEFNDNPRGKHQTHPLLETVDAGHHIVRNVLFLHRQPFFLLIMLSDIKGRHFPFQSDQKNQGYRSNDKCQAKGRQDPFSRTEPEKSVPETDKNKQGRCHGTHRCVAAVFSQKGARLPLIGKIHGERIPDRHGQMIAQRINKYKKLHEQIARRQHAQHEHSQPVQAEADHGQGHIAAAGQCCDHQNTHHARKLSGNLQQAPLHGIHQEDTLEIIGNDTAAKADGNRE